MNGLTVRLALDLLALAPGSYLGVTGAAGIIGRYAIQLGVADGLNVIAQCAAKDADTCLTSASTLGSTATAIGRAQCANTPAARVSTG